MKKLIFLLGFIIVSVLGFSQTSTVTISDSRTEAIVANTLTVKLAFNPPHRDTTFTAITFGQIIIRPADSLAYISTGLTGAGKKHWVLFGSLGTSGAQWGTNITGDISTQVDLQTEFNTKQNILPAGASTQYWDATGALRTLTIPAQLSLTSPNASISIGGVYPNLTLQNAITNLSQLTNGPGFITANQLITVSGDATGSGTTSIPIVLTSVVTAGSCTLCNLTWDVKGRVTVGTNGSGTAPVSSVFTRTGAVVAVSGDYTAAQVTNAVDQTGSYTNPSWLVSIPFTKITAKPTTIAGYGITDNLVNTFNTRTGAVTLSSGDVTTALGYTPVTNARTLTINGVAFDLTANRSWTVAGTGTLNRISPIDSLGATINGIQISGQNIVPSTATATTNGMEPFSHWKEVDSIIRRVFTSKIVLGHAGAGKWGAYSSPLGDSLYAKNWANGKWTIAVTANDSSNHYDVDSATEHTYWNNYFLPLTNTVTINGITHNLSANPSYTVSAGVSDTASAGVAGLMSAYNYNKTQHPLYTWNDSVATGVMNIFHSNLDTLFARATYYGYGMKSFMTQSVIYPKIDSFVIASVLHDRQGRDSLGALINLKQAALSGTGYSKWSGTTPSYLTATQVTADLNVFTSTLQGLVPAGGTNANLFLNQTGGWTTPPGAGAGVASFNTRTGAVVSASGDYTAAQVTNAVDQTGSYSNPAWITSLPWSKIGTTPTTIAGYGITDALVHTFNGRNGVVVPLAGDYTAALVTNAVSVIGSYSNPAWITALAWSKIGTTPTTIAGYGITDPIVLTSGTYADPAWLTTLSWAKLIGKPTTVSGFGISDGVSTGGSYSDPSWITALAWSKLTGVPPNTTTLYSGAGGVAGSTAEASLLSSFAVTGSQTFPANFILAGKTIHYRITGLFSSGATPGTTSIRVKFGSTTIYATTIAFDASLANKQFLVEGTLIFNNVGVSGQVEGAGEMRYLNASGGTNTATMNNFQAGAATINTTISQFLDVTIQNSNTANQETAYTGTINYY